MTAHRAARVVTVAAALVPLAGCAYLRERGRDFTDIVDVKGGAGGIGLGVKARATEFVGTGVGYGATYETTEKFGRLSQDSKTAFAGLGICAIDGQQGPCAGPLYEISILGPRIQAETLYAPWRWFRFGGEVVLPGVRGGLFVNLGEIVDFLGGVVGLDPVGDDGVEIGAPLEAEDYTPLRERTELPPAPPEAEETHEAK